MKTLLFFTVALFFTQFSFANQCISGDPKATQLLDQMKAASQNTDSPTFHIFQAYKKTEKVEGQSLATGLCQSEDCQIKFDQLEDLKKFAAANDATPGAPNLLLKTDCLVAGSKFKASTSQISCPTGNKSKNFNFCINRDFLEYQNAVISSFMSCAAKSGIKTLDAGHLMKMYTLESGFRPNYAYPGGVGIGQLTSIFVKDIHQAHRGRKYLINMAMSESAECRAAKMISEKDLKKEPKHSDNCSFVSVGDGLERNILYSILGTATAWEKNIEPKLRKYFAKYKNHPQLEEVKNLALLNSYGPTGHAVGLLERLSKYPPDRFVQAMKKPQVTERGDLTKYIQRSEARQNAMAKTMLSEPLKTQYAKNGVKACLN